MFRICSFGTLSAGVTVSTIQARRAQRRFAEVRSIAHAVLYDIYDAIRDLPGSIKAREAVVKTALQYLDGLAREASGDPGIQLELAEAYQRVGDVQGAAMERSLGKSGEAVESYRRAMKIADELAASHPESEKAILIRMSVREQLGDMAARRTNDLSKALELYRQAVDIGEAEAARNPSHNKETLRILSSSYVAIAREESDSSRASASARKGLAMLQRAAESDSSAEMKQRLTEGYSMLGTALLLGNELDESLQNLLKAVDLRESLAQAYPLNDRYRRQLMIAYSKVGDLMGPITPSLENPDVALEYYRKMLALAEKLAMTDPADKRAAFDRGMALLKTGNAMTDHAAALAMLRQSLAVFQGLAANDPTDRNALRTTGHARSYMARHLADAGQLAESLLNHREVIRIGERMIAEDPAELPTLRGVATSYREGAKLLAIRGERAEALRFSERAITLAGTARAIDPGNAVTQALTPQAYAAAGTVQAAFAATPEEWTRARDWFEKSAAGWERIQPQHGWPKARDSELARAKAEAARCARAAKI